MCGEHTLDWLYDSLSSPPVAGVWWEHTLDWLYDSLLSTCSWCVVRAYTWLALWLSLSTCSWCVVSVHWWLYDSLSSLPVAGVWWATLDWLYALSLSTCSWCDERTGAAVLWQPVRHKSSRLNLFFFFFYCKARRFLLTSVSKYIFGPLYMCLWEYIWIDALVWDLKSRKWVFASSLMLLSRFEDQLNNNLYCNEMHINASLCLDGRGLNWRFV